MSEEMEKYGAVPEENNNFDEIIALFDGEEESQTEMRKKLRDDEAYAEHFSTTKQQQFLHIMFDKLELDLKDYLEKEYGIRSTKLLYKKEISTIIEDFKMDYEEALDNQKYGGNLF